MQPWLQPSDHVLVSFFAQLVFWHFSAATESSAVHEPYLQTKRRHLVYKCKKLLLLADSQAVTMSIMQSCILSIRPTTPITHIQQTSVQALYYVKTFWC